MAKKIGIKKELTKKQMHAMAEAALLATQPFGIDIPSIAARKAVAASSFEDIMDRIRVAAKYMALEIEAGRRELEIVINSLGGEE